MSSPSQPVQYAYHYSREVVERFISNYGRVTIFVAKKLRIEPRYFVEVLTKAFMYRNHRWQVLREVLKKIDNQDLYNEIAPLSRIETVKYLTCISTLCEDDLLDLGFK